MKDAQDKLFGEENFDVDTLQDEIRVDELCQRFLRLFYLDLVENRGLNNEEAAALAYGADYFLRDFIVADRCENIFRLAPQRVRQFGGTWYIVKNLEPNIAELSVQLQGIAAFYRYCAEAGKVSRDMAAEIERQCSDISFYRRRIESFWEITGDGYLAWNKACSLED